MAANQVTVSTPGPAGPAGIIYEGAWAVDTVYQVRDLVRYTDNNLYVNNVQHTATAQNTPVLDTTTWTLFINADDAFQWATKGQYVLISDSVGNSGYSSKHQALQSKNWASLTTDAVRNDTNNSDVDYSSKAWAIGGTEVTTTSARGAAKEWAITTGGQVDTAEYSAKEYAIGTTATSSKTYAIKVDGAVTGTDYSSKAWSIGGTGVTDTANRGASKEWATTTGGKVDGGSGDYSAKEYAIGTTASTGGSSKDYAQYTGGGVRGATSDHSAKAWAVGGTGVTTTSGKGAAKQWATTTGGQVDTSEYSSKEYAQGSVLAAGGSAKNWAQLATTPTTTATDASAKEWAIGTSTHKNDGSAKSWAQDANAVDGAGANDRSAKAWSQGASMTGATLGGSSKDWASLLVTAIDGTSFSSKEYAVGVTASTGGSAKDWAIYTAADVRGASSGDMSAKEWAVGVLGRGVANEGSAKDWATRTGATVDNAEYSAKHYANLAATTYDNFDDRYLGQKSSDPSVDNDGASLITGALYFDTTNNKVKVYNGSSWQNATSSVEGVIASTEYTSSSASTRHYAATFDAGMEIVYLNGVKLVGGTSSSDKDYICVNGGSSTTSLSSGGAATHIHLNSDTVVGDVISVIAWGASTNSLCVPINGGTFTGNLTAPQLTLTGELRGPASMVIDPAVVGDNSGTLTIRGNLTVDGTTTTINSTTMTVDDKNLILASGSADSSAANGAGITIDGASATMLYTHATTSFDFNKPVNVTGAFSASALTVDDVAVDGKVLTMTGSASDTAVFTAGTNGTLSIVTTDAAAAAANIQITADGTVDIDSAGVLTLDSGAAINIEPASGSAILLDGTISVDAGVVTGATSITSTAFVGTLSTAAQTNITSLGTLTSLTGGTGDLNWDSGTLFVDTSTNNIGMGTATPFTDVIGSVDLSTFGLDIRTAGAATLLVSGADRSEMRLIHQNANNDDKGMLIRTASGTTKFISTNHEFSFVKDNILVLDHDTGNVGIGTGSIDQLGLHIKTTADASFGLRVENDDTIGQFYASSGGVCILQARSNSNLSFGTNDIQRMSIDTSGNVEVGTTTGYARIQPIAGNNNLPTYAFVGDLDTGMFRPTGDTLAFATAGAQRIRIDSTGNVGIGMSPASSVKLDITQGTAGDGYKALNILNSVAHGDDNHTHFGAMITASSAQGGNTGTRNRALYLDALNAHTNQAMFVDNGDVVVNSGNVGIGDSTPESKLKVYQNASGQHPVLIEAGSSVNYAALRIDQDGAAHGIFVDQDGNGTGIEINNSGTGMGTYIEQRGANTGLVVNTDQATQYICKFHGSNAAGNGVEIRAGDTSSQKALGIMDHDAANTLMAVYGDGSGYLKANAWTYGSDKRLKENIEYVSSSGMDVVTALKPCKFDYINGAKNNFGFIAQDVETAIPEAVQARDDTLGTKGLKSNFIIPWLVKALQEANLRISALENA